MSKGPKFKKVGIVELVGRTAALHTKMRPAFWLDLVIKKQLYSVMPQSIAVWARKLGCETHYATMIGLGSLEGVVPTDIDLLFIATPTQLSAVAYAMARIYRQKGVTVVMGGSHTRAFPFDAARFADITVMDADRQLIEAILRGDVPPGTIVQSKRPLADLPLVEERAAEIEAAAFTRGRQTRTTTIALLSSLGCPYDCDFCSEWNTPYAAFDTARMSHELGTIARRYPNAIVGFHDPNFGVRFDQTIDAFEAQPPEARNPFLMEASLSLLGTDRLKRLADVGCVMVAPGIESWADFSKKSKTTTVSGLKKFEAVSAKMREIEEILPTAQANLILGVDADAGDDPFELTKRFILRHPKTWINVNIPTPFGSTPFAERARSEGRIVEGLPLSFYTAPYVSMRPLNYDLDEYLARLMELYEVMISPRLLWKRLRVQRKNLIRAITFARTSALRVEVEELRKLTRAISVDRGVRAFYLGDTKALPHFYAERLRLRFGNVMDIVPEAARAPVREPRQAVMRL